MTECLTRFLKFTILLKARSLVPTWNIILLLDNYWIIISSLESFINSYVEVAVHRKYPIFISKTLIKYLL